MAKATRPAAFGRDPTGCSSFWASRWFRELSEKRLRRGVFHSVDELERAIEAYVEHHNENPKRFVWKKKADEIWEKVARTKATLDRISSI